VLIAPWVLHHHRRFWIAPARFDPSRCLPDRPVVPVGIVTVQPDVPPPFQLASRLSD
jgi:cytochrome P450